jgi:hypothetical protein
MVNLVETPDKFEVYVTEKPGPRLDKGFLKDGIHLTVPQIVIRPSIQLMLREDVLGPLSAILGPLNLANQIEDVVDEAVIERNNWMMYGSKKPGGEPYAVTRRFLYEVGKESEVSARLSLAGVGEERPRAEYVELLSIRNKFVELRVKEAQRDRAEAYVTKTEDERKQKEEAKAAAEEAALAPRPISDEGSAGRQSKSPSFSTSSSWSGLIRGSGGGGSGRS